MFNVEKRIDYLFKIGGSLLRKPDQKLNELVNLIEHASETHRIVLTNGSLNLPGLIRNTLGHIIPADSKAHETNKFLLRDCVANYLAELSPIFTSVDSPNHVYDALSKGMVPILRQSELISLLSPFEIREDLTADSVACYLANILGAHNFVILTDVPGIYKTRTDQTDHSAGDLIRNITADQLSALGATCVDSRLSHILKQLRSDCWVMDGFNTKNISLFLSDGNRSKATLTHITYDSIKNRSYDLETIIGYIDNQYLDCDVTFPEDDGTGHVTENIRTMKGRAFKEFLNEPKEWLRKSSYSNNSWENRLAFTTAKLMERLGVAVFTGAIESGLYFGILADQVVEDWLLCYNWVTGFRESALNGDPTTPVKRRYAEWLALHTYLHYHSNQGNQRILNLYLELYSSHEEIVSAYENLTTVCNLLNVGRPDISI
jgi:aspartokinase-like uncharacterized kinase